MPVKKLLIIGGNSSIGSYLFNNLDRNYFQISKTTRNKSNINQENIFLDLQHVQDLKIDYSNYDIVIFCAALTSVAECEKNPKDAFLINHLNTIYLIKEFVKNNVFVILFSTSQVFSGNNKIEYVSNQPNPISIYGKTKEILEIDLIPYLENICVLRCTKIIFETNDLFRKWVSELNIQKPIYPYSDIHFSPISIEFLMFSILEIINKKIVGLNQISSQSEIKFSEAAFYISKKLHLNSNLINPKCFNKNNDSYIPKYSFLKPTLNLANIPSPTSALDYYIRKNHE